MKEEVLLPAKCWAICEASMRNSRRLEFLGGQGACDLQMWIKPEGPEGGSKGQGQTQGGPLGMGSSLLPK